MPQVKYFQFNASDEDYTYFIELMFELSKALVLDGWEARVRADATVGATFTANAPQAIIDHHIDRISRKLNAQVS